MDNTIGSYQNEPSQFATELNQSTFAKAEFGLLALRDLPQDTILIQCCDAARAMFKADYSVYFAPSEDKALVVRAHSGCTNTLTGTPASLDACSLASKIVYSNKPVMLDIPSEVGVGVPQDFFQYGLSCGIGVPVNAPGYEYPGVLVVLSIQPDRFVAQDLDRLQALAIIVSSCNERGRTQNALRDAALLALQTLSGAAMPLCVVDKNQKLCVVSRSFCHLLGYSEKELLGMRLTQLMHDYNPAFRQWQFEQLANSEHNQSILESQFIGKNGSLTSVRNHISGLRDIKGELTGFLLLSQDLTSERGDRESMRLLDLNLEQKVLELAKARDEALDASNHKSAFIANISHELRTPLSAILGLTDLFDQMELTAEQRDYSHIVRDSAKSLLKLVNDLLDISKIEADRFAIQNEPFNLIFLINDIARMISGVATKKGLALHSNVDQSIPEFVSGDSERVRQILLNLIGNAIKFTSNGGVGVSARVANKNKRTLTIRFEVQDTGIGISDLDQTRIFAPFTQLDDGSNRKYEGSGLGLTITKRLIEMMNGNLGVNSESGKGSVFWFELPFTVALPIQHSNDHRIAWNNVQRSEKILVVEDSPTLSKITVAQLSKFGFSPQTAANGKEAVEYVIDGDFDLVLMDCMLPELDGFQATAQIREHELPLKRHTPIIAITAAAMKDDQDKCMQSGMDDYLSKPFDSQRLYEKIEQWLCYRLRSHPRISNCMSNEFSVESQIK